MGKYAEITMGVRIFLILGVISAAISACRGNCIKRKTAEVRKLLNRNIKAGDTRERVDTVLKSADILYEYDRFLNRYQSTVTDTRCGPNDAVSIYVTFNSVGRVSKIEVFESYTAL